MRCCVRCSPISRSTSSPEVGSYLPGHYRFTIMTDDGVRFWVDDWLVLESWQHQRRTYEVTVYLEAGYHRLLVEHWEDYDWAALSLHWEPAFTVHSVFLPLTLRDY